MASTLGSSTDNRSAFSRYGSSIFANALACCRAVAIIPCEMAARPSGNEGLNSTLRPTSRNTRIAAIPRSGEP